MIPLPHAPLDRHIQRVGRVERKNDMRGEGERKQGSERVARLVNFFGRRQRQGVRSAPRVATVRAERLPQGGKDGRRLFPACGGVI